MDSFVVLVKVAGDTVAVGPYHAPINARRFVDRALANDLEVLVGGSIRLLTDAALERELGMSPAPKG